MFQSLRARLIGICVAITTLSLVALALVTFFVVRDNTLSGLDERIGQLTRVHANELTEWVQEKQRITGSLKLAVDQADPIPFLHAAKQAGGFDDTYFGFADKRHVFDHPMPQGYDPTQRPWYQQAAPANGPVLTPAYVDASTGKLTISFAESVGPAGQPTAVVATDMHLDSVTRKVASIHPMTKSFAFLLDGQSQILAWPSAPVMAWTSSARKPSTPAAQGKNSCSWFIAGRQGYARRPGRGRRWSSGDCGCAVVLRQRCPPQAASS